MLALFADDLEATPAKTILEVADRWVAYFWREYNSDPVVQHYKALEAKIPFGPTAVKLASNMRTEIEESQFKHLQRNLIVGFCVAGYTLPDRIAKGFEIVFNPSMMQSPIPNEFSGYMAWGAPNIIQRLINGSDYEVRSSIMDSGMWTGSPHELSLVLDKHTLNHPLLPIRDSIDFVHACIYSTIKAIKFSTNLQICGGSIEIAVITTDRDFRWVRHKQWDTAINEGY
jgi:hypothetical protein